MKRYFILLLSLSCCISAAAQIKWKNVDSSFQPLPEGFHVFKTTDSLDGKPFIAYYAIADLKDKKLDFTVDTSLGRRLTPTQFYEKNEHPLLVVNTTFFSFETNKSLNVVIKDGKLVAYNQHSIALKGKDTLMYGHSFVSAIGINKNRTADIAWTFADSIHQEVYEVQYARVYLKDSVRSFDLEKARTVLTPETSCLHCRKPPRQYKKALHKWKVTTAVGGGPVLVQNGQIKITNEEENKFTGKGLTDKHPRTLMGYTADNKLIVMAIQGRFPNIAEGATLTQEAQLMIGLGCKEALNLDGGGSSCMLINGKETITPSDKQGIERAVPAVFLINN